MDENEQDYEDFYLFARASIGEALIHERLLRVDVEVIISDDDSATPDLGELSDGTLAALQKRGIVAGHSFYMMRNPIWIDDPDVSYQAGEFDAVNGLLPDMAYAVTSTHQPIFEANDMLVPALALGEEENFWHHPAFETGDILKLCLAILGRSFSSHEPMLVVQAIKRGTSNHQKMETLALLKDFPSHQGCQSNNTEEETYLSHDQLGDYHLAFFSPGNNQRTRRFVPFLPDRFSDSTAVFPFLPCRD